MNHDDTLNQVGPDWLALATRTAHVAVGISRLADGVFVDVNDAMCRLYQWRREQILGRTSAELGMWADRQQRERMLELIRQHGRVTAYEARYRNSLGELGELQISACEVEHAGEKYLVGFLTDVTDRRELIEGLRTAQSRLAVVLQSSGLVVFRQDPDLRYTWLANPALGATEADLLGRTDDEVLGAEAAAPLVAIKRRVLQTGQAERADVWVTREGQRGCYDLVVEPERDAAGRVIGILCAAQDITARQSPSAQTQALRRQLQAPITAIQGMAGLIGREPLSARQGERLQRIRAEACDAAGLVRGSGEVSALGRLRRHHGTAPVLVADGNPVLREQICGLLEHAGLRTVPAANGVEAFSLAVQLSPALVLLDMELPQRGGVAAARAMRTMLARRMPIIAMASTQPPDGAARSLDAELDDVIGRPVQADELYDKLLAWLDAR